jgi:hypothetical protein
MTNLNNLKVSELKDQCVARGLETKGLKKADLVVLLQSAMNADGAAVPAADMADPVTEVEEDEEVEEVEEVPVVEQVESEPVIVETETPTAVPVEADVPNADVPIADVEVEEPAAEENISTPEAEAEAEAEVEAEAVEDPMADAAPTDEAEPITTESIACDTEVVATEGGEAAEAMVEDGASAEAKEDVPKQVRSDRVCVQKGFRFLPHALSCGGSFLLNKAGWIVSVLLKNLTWNSDGKYYYVLLFQSSLV